MSNNFFSNFVKQLKGNSDTLHLDLDITWDIPNLLLNSNELLLIMLTKLSMIPFIDDYTKISNDLGLSVEQAKTIQESNIILLQLQKAIKQYCIQQFVLGSIMKSEMDNVIMTSPEISDVKSIDELFDYIENYKNNQSGGNPYSNLSIIGILMILTILSLTSLGNIDESKDISDMQLVVNKNNLINPYNSQMVNISLEDFSEVISEKPLIKSRKETSLNKMVVKYDQKIESKKNELINGFLSKFTTTQSGIEVLQGLIDNFNKQSLGFSQGVENACWELMDKANENGVFSHYMDFDSIDKTKQKIENIEELVKDHNLNIKDQVVGSTVGTVVSAVSTAIITGDPTSALSEAAPYIASLGSSLWDSLTNTKKITEETKKLLEVEEKTNVSTQLTIQQKMDLENKIYHFSKFYCSNGYNLQLDLQGTNIQVIGDKIEYDFILNVIALLESNLDLKITNASLDKDVNKLVINILISLQQRLEILKAITNKLFEIINFSLQTHITRIERVATPDSLSMLDKYFDDQLKELNNMLTNLNKEFPKKEQQLMQEASLFMAEKKIKEFEDDLKLQQTEAEAESQQRQNAIVQRVAEMKAEDVSASWKATKTISRSYIDLALNGTSFIGEGLGDFTKMIGDSALKVPLGAAKSFLDFINNFLWLLITNPSGWLILGSGLIFLSFWFGGIMGFINIFKYGGSIFVTFTYGGFMFIYKLIKTPFGYIYRKEDIIAINPQNNQENQENQEIAAPLQIMPSEIVRTPAEQEAASGLLMLSKPRGGRTKRHRNKKKFNKTKRSKNNSLNKKNSLNKNRTNKRKKINKKRHTRHHK
jgi:hypothetical protein